MSETADRTEAAASRTGTLRATGVSALRGTLASADTAVPFAEWAGSSFTKLVRVAVKDLALNGFNPAPSDPSVAYGMTLGLQLAAQLMEDPSVVYPDVFSGTSGLAAPSPSSLAQTFGTAPDEA